MSPFAHVLRWRTHAAVALALSLPACADPECPEGTTQVGKVCRRMDAALAMEEAGVVALGPDAAVPVDNNGAEGSMGPMLSLDATATSEGGGSVLHPIPDAGASTTGECDRTRECSPGFTCIAGKCASVCVQMTCDPNATCAVSAGVPVCTCNGGFVAQGTGAAPRCLKDTACSELGCHINAECKVGVDALRQCVCKPGYTGTGTSCTPVSCQPLTIQNGTVVGGSTFGESVTYRCNDGHSFAPSVGSPMRMCGADMSWSGTAPRCDPVSCGLPPTVANATVSPAIAGVYNGTATYSCNTNHVASGNTTITCQITGSWTTPPTCNAVPVCGNNRVEAGEDCEPGLPFQDAWTCNRITCKRTTTYNSCLAGTIGQPNTACGTDEVCTYGFCTPSCSTTSQCPEPPTGFMKACVTETSACVAGGCRSSGDCAAGLGCVKDPGAAVGACRGCALASDCQSGICVDHNGTPAPLVSSYGRCR
jgi:hypothetical protein